MRYLIYNPTASHAVTDENTRTVTQLLPLLHNCEHGNYDAVILPYMGELAQVAAQIRKVCDMAILVLGSEESLESLKPLIEDETIDGVVFSDKGSETESMALATLASGKRAGKIAQLEQEVEQLETRLSTYTHGRIKTTRFIINKAARLVGGIATISTILYNLIKLLWN